MYKFDFSVKVVLYVFDGIGGDSVSGIRLLLFTTNVIRFVTDTLSLVIVYKFPFNTVDELMFPYILELISLKLKTPLKSFDDKLSTPSVLSDHDRYKLDSLLVMSIIFLITPDPLSDIGVVMRFDTVLFV
jgi:hypothetical protein